MRNTFALALGLAFLAGPALAADEKPKDVDSKTAKRAVDRFKREFDTVDIDFKLEAIKTVAKVQHPSVATQLMKHLKSEDKHVRREVAKALGGQPTSGKKAGSKLMKMMGDTAEEPKVVAAAVNSIGRLDYKRAKKVLEPLIYHDDDGIVIEVFGVYGRWKDDSAMKKFLDWFETYPDEKDFKAVSVTVDTGTAGNADQKAAEAKGKAMLAKQAKWRPRPLCTKALRDALKEITGHAFRRPADLRSYLDEPRKYQDPEKILERMAVADQMARYKQMNDIAKKALDIAKDKVPEDDDGEARGKVYWFELRKMRKEMLEKHGMTLSELDVIMELGKSKDWPY